MTKIIKQRQKGFTTVDNSVIRDERLTWKARGIFSYLWSQSDDWNFYETEIANHSVDGRNALRSGLKELENIGYLKRKRVRNDKGQVTESKWVLAEHPMFDKPMYKKPMYENPTQDNRTLRTTNLKNYQLEEVTTERKRYSPADAAPPLPYQEIVDYLNQKAGTKYRSTTKKTQTLIKARFNEKFALDDFKQVIDNKVSEWKLDNEMSKYLRPETLFGTKFESYLNQSQAAKSQNYGGGQVADNLPW